jgi:hypothetical protein
MGRDEIEIFQVLAGERINLETRTGKVQAFLALELHAPFTARLHLRREAPRPRPLDALEALLQRMSVRQHKKTPELRALSSWPSSSGTRVRA